MYAHCNNVNSLYAGSITMHLYRLYKLRGWGDNVNFSLHPASSNYCFILFWLSLSKQKPFGYALKKSERELRILFFENSDTNIT